MSSPYFDLQICPIFWANSKQQYHNIGLHFQPYILSPYYMHIILVGMSFTQTEKENRTI